MWLAAQLTAVEEYACTTASLGCIAGNIASAASDSCVNALGALYSGCSMPAKAGQCGWHAQ
jgi:hypothetical protein